MQKTKDSLAAALNISVEQYLLDFLLLSQEYFHISITHFNLTGRKLF